MIEIKDLLGRLNAILLSKEDRTESVRKIIFETTGIDITKGEIVIKNNTIYLNTKSIYKSEIFLKQEKILAKLEEAFGNKSPKNIR